MMPPTPRPASAADQPKIDDYRQPVGPDLGDWETPSLPVLESLQGRTVRLDPLDSSVHTQALAKAFNESPADLWTYLPWGPYSGHADAEQQVASMIDTLSGLANWQAYAVVVDGQALGMASYLRMNPRSGSIEIGGICFS